MFDALVFVEAGLQAGLRTCAVAICLVLFPTSALAQAELRVFVTGAMKEPVEELGAAFARRSLLLSLSIAFRLKPEATWELERPSGSCGFRL